MQVFGDAGTKRINSLGCVRPKKYKTKQGNTSETSLGISHVLAKSVSLSENVSVENEVSFQNVLCPESTYQIRENPDPSPEEVSGTNIVHDTEYSFDSLDGYEHIHISTSYQDIENYRLDG